MKVRADISWFWAAWGFGFATWNGAVLIWGDNDWWWLNAIACALCLLSGIASVFELSVRSGATSRKAGSAVAEIPKIQMHTGGLVNSSDLTRYLTQALTTTSFTNSSNPAPEPPDKKGPESFHGLPFEFAVGEVYGLRMWHMDKYGRLRARNWDGAPPWRPGVNVARCVKRNAPMTHSSWSFPVDYTWTVVDNPGHEVPSDSCSCGFYAYTDDLHAEVKSHARNGEEPVLGIIKGTGRTLIGTQGFRSEKAEIVAFRDPTRGGAKTDAWRTRQLVHLRCVYPEVPVLDNRAALLEFAPLTETMPAPTSDEFWRLP